MTLDAGVQWKDAYDAVESHNLTLVGGISFTGSVGTTGGWPNGGGHSVLAHTYGLGEMFRLRDCRLLSYVYGSRRGQYS